MSASCFPRLLLGLGLAGLGGALAWWWLTYANAVTYDYISLKEASLCLLGNSDTCALARALCSADHPILGLAYWSASFWLGLAALSGGLFTAARR